VLHMKRIPLAPNQGLSNVEQFRLGRQQLLSTPFEEFEKRITDQLDRMLGPGASSRHATSRRSPSTAAARLCVRSELALRSRHPGPRPYVIGRKRCGSVTIANSDAAWNAYAHEAIDQAWRAVVELQAFEPGLMRYTARAQVRFSRGVDLPLHPQFFEERRAVLAAVAACTHVAA